MRVALAVPGAFFVALAGMFLSKGGGTNILTGGGLLFVGVALTAVGVMLHVDLHSRGLAARLDRLNDEIELIAREKERGKAEGPKGD